MVTEQETILFRPNDALVLLPPATKLWQGNAFTRVCDSVQGGVSIPACTTGHMTGGVSVQEEVSVQGRGGLCPGGSLFRGDPCPGGSLSRGSLLGRPPYGNERVVRILQECIFVFFADAIRQAAVTSLVVTNTGPVLTTSQPLTTQARI